MVVPPAAHPSVPSLGSGLPEDLLRDGALNLRFSLSQANPTCCVREGVGRSVMPAFGQILFDAPPQNALPFKYALYPLMDQAPPLTTYALEHPVGRRRGAGAHQRQQADSKS